MNEPRLVLRDCIFSGSKLEGDLRNIDFTRSTFKGARIYDCDISGSILVGVDFTNADFRDVNLQGVNLEGAILEGAHFYSVMGVHQFGPIGTHGGRMWTAVDWGDKIMFHTKKFWGTEEEAILMIREEYWDSSLYEQQIKLAAKILENKRKYY